MELSSRPHQSLVHSYIAGAPDSATGVIKFDGHSLGNADCSYFQAIPDEMNLYETILTWFSTTTRTPEWNSPSRFREGGDVREGQSPSSPPTVPPSTMKTTAGTCCTSYSWKAG